MEKREKVRIMIRRGKEEERREGEARLSVEHLLRSRNLGDCFMGIISPKLHHFIIKKNNKPKTYIYETNKHYHYLHFTE